MASWYMSKREIEENSPSRKDGIDTKYENRLRYSYAGFIKKLGKTLDLPPITTATAVILCQRFFLRQSLAKNDPWTIARVCMFLAVKLIENRSSGSLRKVIQVSFEMIHEKDPAAARTIKNEEVYQRQKELILLGEMIVLFNLGFDLDVKLPYGILNEAVDRINVATNELGQAAWNFLNDGLSISLWLQFQPKHITAGAIFMAAKLLRVELPKGWWRELGVTQHILEAICNQLLDLYEELGVGRSRRAREAERALRWRLRG